MWASSRIGRVSAGGKLKVALAAIAAIALVAGPQLLETSPGSDDPGLRHCGGLPDLDAFQLRSRHLDCGEAVEIATGVIKRGCDRRPGCRYQDFLCDPEPRPKGNRKVVCETTRDLRVAYIRTAAAH
jgi:hypothetical protein